MDDVVKEIKPKVQQSSHIGYKNLENFVECVFASDLVMFVKNRNELKYNSTLCKETLKTNININMKRTKIMIMGGKKRVEKWKWKEANWNK